MSEVTTDTGEQTNIETPVTETVVDVDPFTVPKVEGSEEGSEPKVENTEGEDSNPDDKKENEDKKEKEDGEKGKEEVALLSVEELNLPPELLEEMSDYGYDVPVGMKMLNDFIREKGADPALAKELAQELYIEKMIKPALKIAREKVERDVTELRDHYGSDQKFDEAQNYVQKAFKQAFGADATAVTTALRLGGLGVEPAIFKGFERIGRMLGEDQGNSATDKGKVSGGKADLLDVFSVPKMK